MRTFRRVDQLCNDRTALWLCLITKSKIQYGNKKHVQKGKNINLLFKKKNELPFIYYH